MKYLDYSEDYYFGEKIGSLAGGGYSTENLSVEHIGITKRTEIFWRMYRVYIENLECESMSKRPTIR